MSSVHWRIHWKVLANLDVADEKTTQIFYFVAVLMLAGIIAAIIYRRGSTFETAIVRRDSIREAIYGIGTVTAQHQFTYKVAMMKTIEKIYVREGDIVKPGQPLLYLADTGTIRSPIGGVVTYLPYNVGENTTPNSPIAMVQNLENRYIKASLEQQSALRVRRGLRTTLSFENLRGQIFEGTVRSLFSKDSQFYAIIDIKNLPSQILPDMTADVAIEVDEKKDVLLIPVRSLSAGFVTKVQGNKQIKVPVTVGLADEDNAEVLSGNLQEGDILRLPGK